MIVQGWWCSNCEFFESDDEVDTSTDSCRACGCNGAAHKPVEIVDRTPGS